MATHRLDASAKNVHWGHFGADVPPRLTVQSGDTVEMLTVSGRADILPAAGSGMTVPDQLHDVLAHVRPEIGPHILTGPVAVEGAEPGDTLEVRIERIDPAADWGYNAVRPLVGTLPEDFPTSRVLHIPVDRQKRSCRLPWGTELPLRPFFGVMGVAPPPAWGSISSIQPRAHGGNLDNKELIPGARLFLPVFNEGGLLSMGDGHAVQGDGEVCTTAIETALQGTVEVVLHKGMGLDYPRAETDTHLISMGMDPDLDDAASAALRRMIDWITSTTPLTRHQAFMLMSLAADVRVTQLVNEHKGIHVMLPRSALPAA